MSARWLVVVGSAAALTACMAETPPPRPVAAADGCSILASRGWSATLDKMPGPGPSGPSLTIAGEVDLPTPGYRTELVAGPADRMMPPSQRFRLIATAPGGMVAQVVTPTRVAYRARADYPAYRSIVILCGERTITTISDVAVVN